MGSPDGAVGKVQLPPVYADEIATDTGWGGGGQTEENQTDPSRSTGLLVLRSVQVAKHVEISLFLAQCLQSNQL